MNHKKCIELGKKELKRYKFIGKHRLIMLIGSGFITGAIAGIGGTLSAYIAYKIGKKCSEK